MYTPGQVQEMLGLPPSSLRRLSVELKAYLSQQQGRHRRYTEQDILTLRRVRKLTGQGKSLQQIKQELAIPEETPAAAGETLALVPTIAGELARMDDNYRALQSVLEQLQLDRAADQERLKRLQDWAALPWWKRLFTPPPF